MGTERVQIYKIQTQDHHVLNTTLTIYQYYYTGTWIQPSPYISNYYYTGTGLLNNLHLQKFIPLKKKYLSQCGKCTYWPNPFTMYSYHNTFWPVHYSGWRLWASHLHKSVVFQFNGIHAIVSNHNSHTHRLFHPTQQQQCDLCDQHSVHFLPPTVICTKKSEPDFLRYVVINFTSCFLKTLSCWKNITFTLTLLAFQAFHTHILHIHCNCCCSYCQIICLYLFSMLFSINLPISNSINLPINNTIFLVSLYL